MSAKVILEFCAYALLIQIALSQCVSVPPLATSYNAVLPAPALDSSCGFEITATNGGALPVTSVSPYPPENLVVASENIYEGALNVAGELPFIGAVGFEGQLPSAGSGIVNYGCGSQAKITNANFGTGGTNFGYSSGMSKLASMTPSMTSPAIDFKYPSERRAPLSPAVGPAIAPNYGFNGARPGSSWLDASAGSVSYPTGRGVASPVGNPIGPIPNPGGIYGGTGEGNVAVIGEIPVMGNTVIIGQIPILGGVNFLGEVPASGSVSISGSCSCGCERLKLY